MRAKLLLATFMLLSVSCTAGYCYQDEGLVRSFTQNGRKYELRFLEKGKDLAWPVDLALRWRNLEGGQWHVIDRIQGVRIEREVKLRGRNGEKVRAWILSSPGASAEFISVVQLRKRPPSLVYLLKDELQKGTYDYRFDRSGCLTGIRFHYNLWHVEPQVWSGHGHVYSKTDTKWDARRWRFVHTPVLIDHDAERKASLAELVTAFAAESYLGVEIARPASTADRYTVTAVYRPMGILRAKTPRHLRSAKRIKAVVEIDSRDEQTKHRLLSIAAVKARS